MNLTLHQTLKEITGTFLVRVAETNLTGSLRADLWGAQLRFDGYAAGQSYAGFRMIFDGHAAGEALEGRLDLVAAGKELKGKWLAKRESNDFTGEWEWSAPAPGRSVKLNIVRTNGGCLATFFDKGQHAQVEDFYDFGGGFYFTHMVDKEETSPGAWSVRLTQDAGWLIGEAAHEGSGVTGNLWFYPHPGSHGSLRSSAERQEPPPDISVAWKPNHL
jgi:hypothetical protein